MTILGRYLSKMRMKQFSSYTWADTERLRQEADAKKAEVMARQGYSGEEIEQAINTGTMPEKPEDFKQAEAEQQGAAPIDLNAPDFFDDELTEEDKKYLTLKWGKAYRPYEWVQLEKLY
jgi:hypothetical protein